MRFSIVFLFLLFGFVSLDQIVASGFYSLVQDELMDSARYYNNLGIENYRAGNYEEAAEKFKRSLNIKKEEQGRLSVDMATTYTNLGAVNRRLYNLDDAMLYYDSAGYVFLEHYGQDHLRLGAVYHNQGNLLRDQREVNSALSYYNNALRIFHKNDRKDWVATLYNNIGIAYWMAGRLDEAIDSYFSSMELRTVIDPAGVAFPAGNLALCYREKGEMKIADSYYRISIDAITENLGNDHPNLAANLMNYGLFLIEDVNEPDRGYEMLVSARDIFLENFGERGDMVARIYMNLGYYHELTGDHNSALYHYQKSLTANSSSFNSLDISDNPGPDDHIYSPDYMLESLKHKAFALYNLGRSTGGREYFESSLCVYRIAMNFIDRIRMGHHTEESKLLLSENEHETFMQAIQVSWKLYEQTGNKRFIEEAFNFSERSKSASLLASFRDFEARSFGGVPEELLDRELELKRGIAAYRELIYEEQRLVEADDDRISMWNERVFSLEIDLRQLIGRLEMEYPDYYALKYNLEVTTVEDVMKEAGTRNALVKYAYADSLIFIFAITENTSNLYRIELNFNLEPEIAGLLNVLTSGNLDRQIGEDYKTFTSIAGELYMLLIDPVVEDIKNSRLVIVPDGILAYIPFELLLTSSENNETGQYRNLPYLLRDYSVSYNHSATLWRESLNIKTGRGGRVLAMAPDYNFNQLPEVGSLINRQYYRNMLVPLPGAREEALKVAEITKGDVLLEKEATEFRFKQVAGDYSILHFAMHTLLDDENPMYSKLVFSDSPNDEEDGFLNTHEIYNLDLIAGLAVLSSCRSGYGTLRRGEGVMSLARGFLYAGVPSIVMTNWEVEDKSGAEIMISFYKYLLKGYRKDEALRLARIDFLDNADMLRAHPYFWGAYVCIGNPDELFRSNRHYYPIITFISLLLVMLLIVWRVGFRNN